MHACNYKAVPQGNGEGGGVLNDDPKLEQSISEGGVESWTSLLGSEARWPGSTSGIFTISEQRLLRGN